MGIFLTHLDTRCIDDLACDGRGIHMILAPFEYYSELLGQIVRVEEGFLTDFASVPRLPFVYTILGNRARKPAVIHDWLFHHHEVCNERIANRVLLEAMHADGISKFHSFPIYLGVKIGGSSSWEKDAAGNGHSIVDGEIV